MFYQRKPPLKLSDILRFIRSEGTISVLYGIHSPIHSLLVTLAWILYYRQLPKPWELGCIFLHDLGHVGKDYLNDITQKNEHWILGARIAGRLFGDKGFEMVAGHTHASGWPESKLLKADKYSWHIAPTLWVAANRLAEPTLRREHRAWAGAKEFKRKVAESVRSGVWRSNHDMYLEMKEGRGGN